jgi:hypothetical protein
MLARYKRSSLFSSGVNDEEKVLYHWHQNFRIKAVQIFKRYILQQNLFIFIGLINILIPNMGLF